jgi:hypothetical protein
MTLNNSRSVFGERQPGQSFQEPRQVIVIEPSRRDMETLNTDPLAGLQSCMVTESPLLKPIRLVEGNAIDPALQASVRAFKDSDAGTSRQKFVHKVKVPTYYTDRLVASVNGKSPIIHKYPL